MPIPPSAPVSIVAGDTFSATFTFRDQSGVALNLSDSTFRAAWRPSTDAPVSVPFTVNTAQASTGVLTVTMAPTLTSSLNSPEGAWDLERTVTSTGVVTTLLAGSVTWLQDVTR